MSTIKIELNSAGIQALLKGPEVEAFIKGEADRIASNAGPGYGSDTKQMPGRVIASAYTADEQAMQDNLDNNTLLRSIS